MFRSLDIAATGMAAQETKLDTISNNLANANTTGYKRQDAQFEDLMYQNVSSPAANATGNVAPTGVQVGSGARVVAIQRTFSQGAMQQTGNPLDIAIEGKGFLPVLQPSGQVAYTRDGALKLDAQGKIVTSSGLSIEPPITVPADATAITITPDGLVSATQPGQTTPVQLGRLQVTNFPNEGGLQALGHNIFQATAASGDALTGAPGTEGRGSIAQGSLESGNVEVVGEMIALIRTQRAYELNSKVVAAADEMLRNATQLR